jgi:protein tyrosine phosphatase (PTP) superfamily phosphohydrolase (DUF442 family)/ribosomal protein S18 acetylase RimI-like enzyme
LNHSLEDVPHFLRLSDNISTAGQPAEDQIGIIGRAGYEIVVNLRPEADSLPNERAIVEEHGMEYIHIPVVWDAPTVENVEQFFVTMDAHEEKKIFVHCAKNMRVSAFMYLYRIARQNVRPEDAIGDLHRIWVPNSTWQLLIAQVLERQVDADGIVIGMALADDLSQLLSLYHYMNADDPILPVDDVLNQHWQSILSNDALFYVVARDANRVVSTCALTLIPNLTRSARPYGLIENVVTHPDYRKRGIGTRVLQNALDIALSHNCYKVMLLTGRKDEETLRFYEKAGFVRGEKTGFVSRRNQISKATE